MNSRYVGVSQFSIMIHDVGPDKKARVKSIFNYMQANVDEHSRKQGTSLGDIEALNLSWVYARFYAEVRQYPVLHQKIICSTWRSKLEQYLAYRDFTICDENNNVLVAATASLALINRDTRKPAEINVPSSKLFETHSERAVDHTFGRIPDRENYGITYSTSARYEDIDVNNHMNNASYAQVFYESLAGQVNGAELATIDIAFRGEVSLRDELTCLAEPVDSGIYHHKLLNHTKGNVSALAVTKWREN
ncbi:MAG TPA: thioesterase [Spirochaetota bacterium]|nr:thioesterase [Spirochaetota bacterium]